MLTKEKQEQYRISYQSFGRDMQNNGKKTQRYKRAIIMNEIVMALELAEENRYEKPYDIACNIISRLMDKFNISKKKGK